MTKIGMFSQLALILLLLAPTVFADTGADSNALRMLLTEKDIGPALQGLDFQVVEAQPVPLSGSYVNFEHAVSFGGWVLQWNGEAPGDSTTVAGTAPGLAGEKILAAYFTGIGCPHCAKSDPFVLEQLPKSHPKAIIVEYEIYQLKGNAPLLAEYCAAYNLKPCTPGEYPCCGIPMLIFGENGAITGDGPILRITEEALSQAEMNDFPMPDGSDVAFSQFDVSQLPGKPTVWASNRVLVKSEGGAMPIGSELTVAKVLSLAAVDAINPCALAVLTLILIAIMTYNPKDKRNILLAGLAFSAAVFIMYFFYGLVIIKFFQVVQALTAVRLWLYTALGIVAIVLGLLNIKDFFFYKPGSVATEMPMFLRPKMQKIVFGITSPKGAFVAGLFVTLFLLPCTIGPYIIAGGILSALELAATLPWLLLYNAVFVLPMIAITFAVYGGISSVENVSGWKDRNIRYLHLVAGIIMLLLGIAIAMGWV